MKTIIQRFLKSYFDRTFRDTTCKLRADYGESKSPPESVRTGIIWLMPAVTTIYMLALFPFGISSIHWKPMFISLGISVGFASFIQILWIRSRSLGTALLLLFLPLFLIGIYLQALAPIFTVTLVIGSILAIGRIRKLSVKQIRYLLAALLIGGGVIALLLFQRSSMGYAQPFTSLTINRDTLFNVAISSMIKNYGVTSTGLYGLVPIHYHTASHSVFASLSLMSKLSVFDVYSYIYPLVFIPLMLTVFLCLAEEVLPSRAVYGWIARASILSILLIGLDCGIFSRVAFWKSFYESESYTFALILLMGLLSLLFNREKLSHDSKAILNSAVILLLFMLTCLAKISVGFVFFGILGSWIFFGRSKKMWNRLALTSGCVVLFFFAYKLALGSAISFEFFHFIKTYVVADSFSKKLLLYSAFHLLFSNMVIAAYICGTKNHWRDKFPLWLICGIVMSTFLGTIPGVLLSIPGGSAYYFSNVSQMMAFPFLIILATTTLDETVGVVSNVHFHRLEPALPQVRRIIFILIQNMNAAMIVIIIFLTSYFSFAFLPSYKNVFSAAGTLVRNLKQDPIIPYNSFFITELQKISKDPSTKNMMIYLPPDVQVFWKLDLCDRVGFILPAIAERSALRGLPGPECGAQYFGFEDYGVELLTRSQRLDNDEILRTEAQDLGFSGVMVLSEKGTRIIK